MLDGVFAVNGVAFIVGMLKDGMFRFTPADAVVEAGLLLANTELLALFPNGLDACEISEMPVAIKLILA